MNPDRWQKIETLFKEAIALEASARPAFLDERCAGEPEVREQLESLLEHHEQGSGFLANSPFSMHLDLSQVNSDREQRIGRYRLLRPIATGGMGVVYEAEQDEPRRKVAVKLVPMSLVTPEAMARFRHEIEVLARLRHPNVAQIHEAGVHQTDDGSAALPFFAMELIENARPITVFAKESGLGIEERLRLFQSLCLAVHHGHLRGVVHRDLKPGNILVDGEGRLKVIDFGVAKATDADRAATTRATATGELVGTLRYMSPEQCWPDSMEVDHRTDVYSLGVVLYELLTGEMPYEVATSSPLRAAISIQETPPRRPSTLDSHLKGDLDTILLTALKKGPADRYQSVDDLRRDVLDFLEHRPIAARPPTTIYLLSRWARRRRWMAAGLVVAFVSLALGTAVASVGVVKAKASAQEALNHSKKEKAQREIADRKREEAEAVRDLLTNAMRSVDPFTGRRDLTMREFLDAVAPQVEEEQDWSPFTRGKLLTVIAECYLSLDGREAGRLYAERSVEILREIPDVDHNGLVQAQITLAMTSERHDRQGAVELISSVVEGCRQAGHHDEEHYWRALEMLGAYHSDRGEWETAEKIFQEVLDRLDESEEIDERRLCTALHNLGALFTQTAQLERGERILREAVEAAEFHYGERSGAVVQAKSTLAGNLLNQRRWEEAIAMARGAIADGEQLFGPDHVSLAGPLSYLAICLSRDGEIQEAEASLRRSLGILLEEYGQDHPQVAGHRIQLAYMVSALGKHDEGIELTDAALDSLDVNEVKDHYQYAQAWSIQARCHLQLGDLESAAEAFEQALPNYEKRPGLQHRESQMVIKAYANLLERLDRDEEAEELRAMIVD